MTDVVVLGGGIVGASAALHLAEAGASVTLLEAETIAAAASGRNAGSIQHPLDAARAELYEESVAIHRRLGVIGEAAAGLLAVGPDAVDVSAFPGLAAEALRGDALRAIEPELADDLAGVLISGTGFPAHPAAATRALADAARAAGARIEEGVRAAPDVRDGRVAGVTTAGGERRPAGAVLVAAGPWSSALVDPSGAWRPVGALWGVTVQVALPGGRRVRHRIEEWDGAEYVSGVQFEATPLDGVAVLGASRTTAVPDEAALAHEIRERAARFLPVIAQAAVVATRTCGRPVTADGLPLLGPVPHVEGLHLAAGHGPYGISLGPASGRVAADALLGRAPVPAAFAADREAVAA